MEWDSSMQLQLQKISAVNSEEDLDSVLSALWKARRSGLSLSDKSNIQSLLCLASPTDVDSVVASLRVLIRKCLQEDRSTDDILKLFPPELSLDLQNTFVILFQKYQNQWKEDMSGDQHSIPHSNLPYQVSATTPSSLLSFPSPEISTSLWPRQDDFDVNLNRDDLVGSTPVIAGSTLPHLAPICKQWNVGRPNSLGALPCLKSMTWTLEKLNSALPCRVAIISLKLLDYTKSPVGEIEVKFQLTRDTLEAMLRSMTYISEQFSKIVGSVSGPMQKKQKQ
ncbi:hypothetical protein Nepgr_011504 [Nepenthes gracilis]|uniref:COMM domain-containing protein n=1 Tax=Nepenthes gracilis TaxID=150966 RepID=A0AAD3SEB2_NEPGR|nr:hypothetical protein Nepgr_011504 [Nepenthes gracilis]